MSAQNSTRKYIDLLLITKNTEQVYALKCKNSLIAINNISNKIEKLKKEIEETTSLLEKKKEEDMQVEIELKDVLRYIDIIEMRLNTITKLTDK